MQLLYSEMSKLDWKSKMCPICGDVGYGVRRKLVYRDAAGRPQYYLFFRHFPDCEKKWCYLGREKRKWWDLFGLRRQHVRK